jgi:Rrf2 family protein
MIKDSRLSGTLHVLLHMAQNPARPLTSEDMGKAMNTHPVVARRVMGGLRDMGYVRSEKGHGGGWTLSCDLEKVTLLDVYSALGRPELLAIGHRNETSECALEAAVNTALNQACRAAEQLLLERLGELTLSQLFHATARRSSARKRRAGSTVAGHA